MSKVAILTDSNSGITQSMAKEMGIYVVPMPFYINEKQYFEDITLTQKEFYHMLEGDADIKTSMPALGDVMDRWNELLKEYDEVVYIPMSSGLSSSCSAACSLAEEFEGKVQVVDNQRISVTMHQSVLDAMHLRDAGFSAAKIREILEKEKLESSIYITVDTLKYLKKGGRVTPAAAALGTVLNLKPVLQIQGEKLDSYSKARGWKAAKKSMLSAIESDIRNRFAGQEDRLAIGMAYTNNEGEADLWEQEIHAKFPKYDILRAPLSLSVACHIGPGSLAVTVSKIVDPEEYK